LVLRKIFVGCYSAEGNSDNISLTASRSVLLKGEVVQFDVIARTVPGSGKIKRIEVPPIDPPVCRKMRCP
jgi:hypothetical protein